MGKQYKNYFSSRGSFEDTQTPIKTVYYIDKKNAEVLFDKYVIFQGITLIKELIQEYGLDVVIAYMAHIQVTIVSPKIYCLVTN